MQLANKSQTLFILKVSIETHTHTHIYLSYFKVPCEFNILHNIFHRMYTYTHCIPAVFLYVVSFMYTHVIFGFCSTKFHWLHASGCILNFDELIKQSGIILVHWNWERWEFWYEIQRTSELFNIKILFTFTLFTQFRN